MKVGLLLLALAAAGCLGAADRSTTEGMHAADASDAAARAGFEYILFLGVTGTEGPLDWVLYEEALRGASDPGRSIADAFDQDVENGAVGDGELGSWLSTHFVFDEAKRLLGGLYTQYTPEHGVRTAYAPFRGPYPGTVALPGLQHAALDLSARAVGQDATVLCGLVSHTDEWNVDSRQAAAIATGRPIMAQHVAAHPEGEFTYYYFPRLDVEPGCPATLAVDSNHWLVSHADLDSYLAGGSPSIVEVRIDAATGEVLSEGVRPLFSRPPVVVSDALLYDDPLVPAGRVVQDLPLPVEAGARRLDLHVVRVHGPDHERGAGVRLIDPAGHVADEHAFGDPAYGHKHGSPAAGTWRLQYWHHGLEPYGHHELQVRAIVHYS